MNTDSDRPAGHRTLARAGALVLAALSNACHPGFYRMLASEPWRRLDDPYAYTNSARAQAVVLFGCASATATRVSAEGLLVFDACGTERALDCVRTANGSARCILPSMELTAAATRASVAPRLLPAVVIVGAASAPPQR